MIRHMWSVLCERVVIDRDTGSVSIQTCMNDISAKEFPFTIPFLQVGNAWWNDSEKPSGELSATLRILEPEGKQMAESKGTLKPLPSGGYQFLNINAAGFRGEVPGTYLFLISFREGTKRLKEVARLPLRVQEVKDTKGTS